MVLMQTGDGTKNRAAKTTMDVIRMVNSKKTTIIGALVVLAIFVERASCLKCYECENARSNDQCNKPGDLHNCHRIILDQVCETDVTYEESRGYKLINKRCSYGPCSLHGQQKQVIDVNECDTDNPSWSCMSCCNTDGCNKSGATVSSGNMTAIIVCLLLTAILPRTMKYD